MQKLPVSILVAVGTLLGKVIPVNAATAEGLIQTYLPSFSTCSENLGSGLPSIADIFCILTRIISILLLAGGGVSLLFLIIGGLRYMSSGGDEKALTAAKSAITYSILGLIITLGAVFGINQILSILLK